ncbi:hypothetical protein, partial [Pseudomonas sp. PA-3-11C]|uniref:hypothetical protein n=1 Tax=Pseudomonas sp. PA-3-11C TaxID=2665472 RepID=UPI001F3152D5
HSGLADNVNECIPIAISLMIGHFYFKRFVQTHQIEDYVLQTVDDRARFVYNAFTHTNAELVK